MDEEEIEPSWSLYKDEGKTHETEELEAVGQPMKQEEDARCDVALEEEEKKEDGGNQDEELSALPAKTVHCYMTLVKTVREVSNTTAPGQAIAAPNTRKGYSEFPVRNP